MLIANPIYDSVFKYLMEDNDIARRLLSVIIGEEIEFIEVKPQEQTFLSDSFSVLIYRLDFKATIRLETGEYKNILIELQKAKDPVDIVRFRRYLGENYQKEDLVARLPGSEPEWQTLPVITIYILGFKLKNVEASILKVNRVYKDLIANEVIEAKEDFIEQLTHDSFVIQIPRLQTRMQNRIERMLAVFNQAYLTNEKFILNIPGEVAEDELTKKMAQRLQKAVVSEEVRRRLQVEEDFEASIERSLREKKKEILEKEKQLEEKDKVLEEKDKVLEEKDKVLEEKDKVLEEKDKVLEEKDKKIEERDREIEALKKYIAEINK
jgi:hypothetical protein